MRQAKLSQERILKEEKGRGKEREAPTHLIENSKLTHAGRVTKKTNLRCRSLAIYRQN